MVETRAVGGWTLVEDSHSEPVGGLSLLQPVYEVRKGKEKKKEVPLWN